jgi:hypothetical protein
MKPNLQILQMASHRGSLKILRQIAAPLAYRCIRILVRLRQITRKIAQIVVMRRLQRLKTRGISLVLRTHHPSLVLPELMVGMPLTVTKSQQMLELAPMPLHSITTKTVKLPCMKTTTRKSVTSKQK